MKLVHYEAKAVVESSIVLTSDDCVVLGFNSETIHKIAENRREVAKYKALSPSDKEDVEEPKCISLMDKDVHDNLLKELDLIDKFFEKFVIRPGKSNVFDAEVDTVWENKYALSK